MTTAAAGLPPAVIDHAASPAQVYCRNCALGETIPEDVREELSVDQIGCYLPCDGCGEDIAEKIEEDDD